jgi:hypothetical protein
MPATDDRGDAEGAVRSYLVYLEDPRKLRDEAAIQRLTQAVLVADDPIDKLRALAELERAAGAGTGRTRARAVPVDEIKAHVLGLDGPFVLADVMSGVGGSPATVRKAVDELVEAGQVARLGPVPDHSGRGRAPVQFMRT